MRGAPACCSISPRPLFTPPRQAEPTCSTTELGCLNSRQWSTVDGCPSPFLAAGPAGPGSPPAWGRATHIVQIKSTMPACHMHASSCKNFFSGAWLQMTFASNSCGRIWCTPAGIPCNRNPTDTNWQFVAMQVVVVRGVSRNRAAVFALTLVQTSP